MTAEIHTLDTVNRHKSELEQCQLSSGSINQSGQATVQDSEYISKVIKDFITNKENQATSKPASRNNFFNRQDVVKALSRIQLSYKPEYVPGQKVNINTEGFKYALMNSMAKLNNSTVPRSMNQIDGRTIDFVEMIFGAFLRDKNISHAIKSLLLTLQIPVVKTSLLDNNFFYDIKHPARNVLDTVAHIGIGIEDSNDTVYKTMELIIEQLLRSFEQNTVSFRTALASLKRLTDIEQKKQKQNEQQTRQQILQEHARQIVLTELQFHTMSTKIPKPVQPLILNHWSTMMFYRYIKHGKNSAQWNEATDLLNLMIQTLKPLTSKDEWLSLQNLYMGIVNTVKELLGETNQNKEKVYMAVNNLKNTYKKILSESEYFEETETPENTHDTLDSIPVTDTDKGPSPVDVKIESARKKIDKLPQYIKPGTWFEIYTRKDHPVRRLKLSVIIQEDAKLVFVDRLGIKVLEKDAEEFGHELATNKSCILDDHSVFDHALSQVISSISAAK
ncbi:MAG: DUF1631 domain-containing protein [Gammaproteobacteria bacterium]|nr:DUF1631 domain-containing protein [Gammaproteobacteria bacterium]